MGDPTIPLSNRFRPKRPRGRTVRDLWTFDRGNFRADPPGFPAEAIGAYIDDNEAYRGTTVNGRPVVGPDALARGEIEHVVLSMSPVYMPAVAARLRAAGIRLHLPSLPLL